MNNKLIVGLGNPGTKYRRTRHNIGFHIVEALAQEFGAEFRLSKKLVSEIAEPDAITLAKPQTFMNNSGQAVQKLLTTYKPTAFLVIHDEIDLPFGKLKIYGPGGAAGHNGVQSVIDAVGNNFMRLRVGVENRTMHRIPATEDYVLQNFTADEQQELQNKIIPAALGEIKKFLG